MFENQALLFTKEIHKLDKRMDDMQSSMDDQFGEIRARLARIEKQTNEGIAAAYKAIELLQSRLERVEKKLQAA